MHPFRKLQGFTLIEVLLTLSIFALLAGFVSTSLTPLLSSNRHIDVINTTTRMFALARSHAIHSNTLTTICPLSSAMECIDDWNKPVSVFPDANNDRRPDDGEIYQRFEPGNEMSTLYSRTAGRGYFQLSSDGMSHGSMGSLVVCTRSGTGSPRMSYIALNIGGRIRVLNDEDQDGVIRLPWGATLTCPSM